ncbi:MAG: sodium:proton antiporter [Gammaproteobacteria bacterium]|nr:sodium:proton antiporter [Gammaproteobacteria bacterium]
MEHYGFLTVVPTLIVLTLAVLTHRPIESLIAGSIAGLLMLDPGNVLVGLKDNAIAVLVDPDVAWVILVCGLMGSMIGLLIRTGATGAFTDAMTARIETRTSALMHTWVLGLLMFVDDYLNSLAVASSMRKITDKFRVSREMLSYVVDSTAAPVSVIVPISTWAVFFAALLESNGLAEDGRGLYVYIQAIPYMFYAWFAAAIVPLVIYNKIPPMGPMRKAERRAQETGQTIPPGSEHTELSNKAIQEKEGVKRSSWNFAMPMLSLVFFTWYFEVDFLKGIFVTLFLMMGMILATRTLTINDTFDTAIDGFKTMIEPLAVVVSAYIFKNVNDSLGLTTYAIDMIQPVVTAGTLPVVIFFTMASVSFATGSNWGVFVIVLPIVASLGQALGADMTLLIGATLSASTFGSHACFYSDATVLTAQASGLSSYQHAITQLPYTLVAAAAAGLLYLLFGNFAAISAMF